MGRVTIQQPPECKIIDIDNSRKRSVTVNNETINQIKENYYRIMDGLHGLLGVLDSNAFPQEIAAASKSLAIMSKTELESLWMRSK